MTSSWPEYQPDLERLAAAGLPTKLIAEKLGVSRNAVIGRAHRTGVKLQNQKNAHLTWSVAIQGTPFYPCGHPRTLENTQLSRHPSGSEKKNCRACNRKCVKEWRLRQKALKTRRRYPADNSDATHFMCGHPITPENTYRSPTMLNGRCWK